MSIALVGNAAEIEPAWAATDERFELVTDQTSAHDALGGYVPAELTLADAESLRATQPEVYERRSRDSMAAHVRATPAVGPRVEERILVVRARARAQIVVVPGGPAPGSRAVSSRATRAGTTRASRTR